MRLRSGMPLSGLGDMADVRQGRSPPYNGASCLAAFEAIH